VGAALSLPITLLALFGSIEWIGRPFPGFLVLENRVVASAGLGHWPAVRDGAIYQHEILSVDGELLRDAASLHERVASVPPGTEISYELRGAERTTVRRIATRRFEPVDHLLLFGAYLASGVSLIAAAFVIGALGRDASSRGSAVPLFIVGLFAITACDLYGPYRFFALHAFLECLLFAANLHFALVFPFPRGGVARRPWLVGLPYAAAATLGAVAVIGLRSPALYVATHRIAIGGFGATLAFVMGSLLWTWLRSPSFEARQRVKMLAAGALVALAPPIVLTVGSAASGGRASENLAGWSAALFPAAIAYALLRRDLLHVDAIVRRAVSYAALTAAITVVYAGSVAILEGALRGLVADGDATPAVVISALFVAALLPLRDRIQSTVDRLFFRSRYDFRRLLDEASTRFASVTSVGVIREEVERIVRAALAPESTTFEIAPPETPALEPVGPLLGLVEAHGQVIELSTGGVAVPFVVDGRIVGLLVLGPRLSGRPYGGEDRRLLRVLANQAAVALDNALALARLEALNATLEHKVEERTSELARTLDRLRETQKQMAHQEKMASLGQLVAGVAHEINNPLNFIAGNLFHIREHADTLCGALGAYEEIAKDATEEITRRLGAVREERDVEYVVQDFPAILAACQEGVDRATTIVRDLRRFSRIDGGTPSEVDLPGALDATLNLLRGRLVGIEVVREYGVVPTVQCLEGQINQVFMNVLANATDALGDRGTIRVRTRREGDDRVAIEIEDDGPGIPPDVVQRIFDPFFTTKEVGKGTGLGLAISYGIVARHGGAIHVRSEVGRGTCMSVEMPIRFTPAEDQGRAPLGR
jgi:signal transduction histidine kinase